MKALKHYKSNGFFWFRIFGYGLLIKDLRKHSLTFSERNRHRKRLIIGNFAIGYLKRRNCD